MFRFLAITILGLSVAMNTLTAAENVFEVRVHKGKTIGHGSAFYISASRLLTAAHNVLEDGKEADNITVVIDSKEIPCTVVAIDKENDVCLLESKQTNTTWLELDDRPPEVYTIAYPEAKGPKLSEGSIHAIWFTVYFEVGSSGAPIINKATGKVLGIGTQTTKDDRNTCVAVPASILKVLIEKHKEKKP